MLRIAATIGLKTYYFASEDVDYDNTFWEARIGNQFEIERFFDISESTGNRIRSMQITLDNRDNFFRDIEKNDSLLNSKFVLYFNDGDDKVKTFTGIVNKIDSFGDDVSLTLMERGYEYLKNNFPDAQISYDYYSESGINDSWNAIPIPFGTVNKIPLAWVNLLRSEFIIGSGPLFNVNKLYFDKVVVYDRITEKNGYQPTPESPEIKFRIFKGTGSIGSPEVVDGVTSEYPGFAYVQLYKIVDGVEEPADPLTPDGDVSQLYADIEGIVNDTGTAPERNPIKILYMLFTKPYTGYEGYGLEIDPDDLDFDDAILEANIQGFKIDGAIDRIAEFGEWVDELLRCARASLTEEDGKIKVYVDSAKTYSGVHFDASGVNGYECDISPWTEPEVDAQINRLRLSYSWNFERNDFNKKPGVHEESPLRDPYLKDEAHAVRLGKWNTDTIEFKLIKDDTTAHKLAQYYLKSKVKQLKTTSLVTEVRIPNIDAGDLVKVSYEKFGWVEKEFVVTKIKRNEDSTELDIKEYSIDVYTFVSPGEEPEVPGNPHSPYNIPTKPIMNYLEVVNTILQDGSNQTLIKVEFTHTSENAHMVALYFKEASEPESAFWQLDATVNKNVITTIWKGRVTGEYNFRLATITSMGVTSPITIEDGDRHYYGQPTEEVPVSVHVDTEAPGTPSISIVNPFVGGVSIYITIPDGVPEDFAYFKIFRKLGDSTPALLATYHTSAVFTDSERETIEHSRVYYAVAVDRNGNESAMSAASAASTPLKVSDADLSADAIKMPTGALLSLTAKNCTTASIAEVDGVKDVSGNGNHGQANGGTTVISDSEMGSVFGFDGVDDRIIIGFTTEDIAEFSVSVFYKRSVDVVDALLDANYTSSNKTGFRLGSGGYPAQFSFFVGGKYPGYINYKNNEWTHVVGTFSGGQYIRLYENGILVSENTVDIPLTVRMQQTTIGRNPSSANYFNGLIAHPKIFKRALSPSEIKTLYMFPDDVAFGQITADLITTGELITKSAQIKDAIISNAHISDLSAEKINAGTLAADRIAAGSINASKLLIGRVGAALNDDPNFEDPSAWIKPINGTFATVTDGQVGGTVARQSVGYGIWRNVKYIPIDRSKTYRVRLWIRTDSAGNGVSKSVSIGTNYYTVLGGIDDTWLSHSDTPIPITTSWQEFSYIIDGSKFPPTAKYMRNRIGLFNGNGAGYHEMQDLRIEEVIPATLIKDGSIITEKLAVGAVTAEKLLIGKSGAALNDDPNFEDPSAWEKTPYQPFNFNYTLIPDGKVGRYAIRSVSGAIASVMTAKDIPYDSSKTYRIRAWVRATVSTATPSYLGVRWRHDTGDNGETSITIPVSPIDWTEYVVFIGDGTENIAPANTVAVRPYFIANIAEVAGVVFDIQDLRIEECVPSTLIKDGAIRAQHITVEEAVITNKAQINSGVFNQILVLDQDFMDTATTAENAQSTANTALNNANTANTAISNMTNDNKLTPDEKQLTKKEWDIIVSEKSKNDTQADSFGVSKTAYGTAYSALSTYITPLLSDLTTTSDIVGTTFRTKFKDYYDARTDLLNAIATKSKQVADTAKTAVDNWAVAGTSYTQIKGGVITTGQIKSGDYVAPDVAFPPILSLSAENSTTASIAEVGGVKDVSGNGNHGQAFGGVEVVDSSGMGKAFQFDGVDDYIGVANKTFDWTNGLTVSAWIQMESSATEMIIASKSKSTNREFNFRVKANKLEFWAANPVTILSSTTDISGSLVHVAATYDYSELKIYINGILDASTTHTAIFSPSDGLLTIGRWAESGNSYFNGLIVHPRIFKYALSPSEIQTLYMTPDDLVYGPFAQAGSSYDLDNASITTENFYSNETGAGIKGHIEADSGKIGQWQIDQSGSIVSSGIDSYGETAIFGLMSIVPAPMIGRGVKPHPSLPAKFVSSYGSTLGRLALILDYSGLRVLTGGLVDVPIGNSVTMTERFKIGNTGIMALNGYATAQSRAQTGYLKFNGIIIAWGFFDSNSTTDQSITYPVTFSNVPGVTLQMISPSTATNYFFRPSSLSKTGFKCNSNVASQVFYIAIGS